MVKKKPQPKEQSRIAKLIQEAKENRLPSARNKICEGCFGPRNTLTVKPHLEKIWAVDQIELLDGDEAYVKVPCQFCGEIRKLALSRFSKDVFKTDLEDFPLFVLLKDDKYNAFIGIGNNGSNDAKDFLGFAMKGKVENE